MAKKSSAGAKGFSGNIYIVLFMKLLVVLLLFFLSRIFFYLFNLSYFSGVGFLDLMKLFFFGGRFDITAILIINLPIIVLYALPFRFRYKKGYQIVANGYFYVINIVGLMANFIDLIYFRFTLKRTTADIFSYLGVGGDFNKLIPQFLKDFWYVLVIWLLFIVILVWLSRRFRVKEPGGKGKGGEFTFYFVNGLLFIATMAIAVIGIRGGLQLRPISLITAGNYTSAKYFPLILNTPFSIAKSFGKETLKTEKYFTSEKELAEVYTPVHKPKSKEFLKSNVMIIILESVSLEHIGSLNKDLENGEYRGYTPFLDSLISQSLVFKGFANGKTSIQGIPSILSGIPSLMNESYIQSPYSANKIHGLAGLLKSKGYTSAFFHGGTNGTMGFDSYTKLTGFDHYYGRSEYNNEKDYDGKWGIRDEEFFQFTCHKLDQLSQPFFGALFSLSSHHPYYVPGKYSHIFRKGNLPIQESIMYTDFSLREFFKTAGKSKWFDNTLFVITADHSSEGYYPYYQSSVGQYATPFIFYKHGSELKGFPGEVVQQTDIMPSVLDYLGYDQDFIAFGTSVFDTSAPRFSIHYISGIYGLIMNGYLLEYDGSRSTSFYDLSADKLQKNNLISKNLPEMKKMEKFIKAYIQQYNNRFIENRLTAD
jgi:phosphoglycerol transferase MdoB-like AlkP superfamily enzyme